MKTQAWRYLNDHLLAVLVRPAERLDDKAFAAIQAVGQVLLMAGLEMLRVQRRDGRRRCKTNTETPVSQSELFYKERKKVLQAQRSITMDALCMFVDKTNTAIVCL